MEQSKKLTFQDIGDIANTKGQDPYIAGLHLIGMKSLERNRSPHREVSPYQFSMVAPKDIWKNKIIHSNTIRSKKSLEASISFITP
jgi:hypothetical protein